MIFKGQTITLSLDTDVDISGFDGFILYEKPNYVQGQWEGTITSDTVSYDITETDVDVAGVWKVQAYATDGAEHIYGKMTVIEFRTHL
jgi:hypothetical protein